MGLGASGNRAAVAGASHLPNILDRLPLGPGERPGRGDGPAGQRPGWVGCFQSDQGTHGGAVAGFGLRRFVGAGPGRDRLGAVGASRPGQAAGAGPVVRGAAGGPRLGRVLPRRLPLDGPARVDGRFGWNGAAGRRLAVCCPGWEPLPTVSRGPNRWPLAWDRSGKRWSRPSARPRPPRRGCYGKTDRWPGTPPAGRPCCRS